MRDQSSAAHGVDTRDYADAILREHRQLATPSLTVIEARRSLLKVLSRALPILRPLDGGATVPLSECHIFSGLSPHSHPRGTRCGKYMLAIGRNGMLLFDVDAMGNVHDRQHRQNRCPWAWWRRRRSPHFANGTGTQRDLRSQLNMANVALQDKCPETYRESMRGNDHTILATDAARAGTRSDANVTVDSDPGLVAPVFHACSLAWELLIGWRLISCLELELFLDARAAECMRMHAISHHLDPVRPTHFRSAAIPNFIAARASARDICVLRYVTKDASLVGCLLQAHTGMELEAASPSVTSQ